MSRHLSADDLSDSATEENASQPQHSVPQVQNFRNFTVSDVTFPSSTKTEQSLAEKYALGKIVERMKNG